MISRRFVEAPLTEHLHTRAAKLHIPLSGSFELTPVCNMSCRMCYVRMTKKEQEAIHPLRTAEEWLALGAKAKERGMLYLLLTGGEPFLRPDFREIYTGLYEMGFVISINSNGTLIDEETVKWLRKMPPARINMTLYGASDQTYERLCGNPGGFTQIMHAIRSLKDAGINIKINCSVTPYNADDLEEIFAFCEREKLILQATSYMFPPLRRDASMIGKNERFTPEEAAWYSAKIECLANGEEEFLKRVEKEEFPSLPADVDEACLETEGEGIRCRAGKCSFWVTWDGRLLPCGMLPGTGAANVFEIGFDEAWKRASEYAEAIRLPVKCRNCGIKEHCHACAAMVLTESGDYQTVPEYRCQMIQAYPGAVRKLADEIRLRRVQSVDGEDKETT